MRTGKTKCEPVIDERTANAIDINERIGRFEERPFKKGMDGEQNTAGFEGESPDASGGESGIAPTLRKAHSIGTQRAESTGKLLHGSENSLEDTLFP